MLVCSETLTSIHPDSPDIVAAVTDAIKLYGYQKQDIGNLTLDTNTGSRDLLLAFSWLLAKECLTERVVLDALRTLPVDTHFLYRSTSTNEHTRDKYINLSGMALSDRFRQVVWLFGKCKMSLKSLILSTQECTASIHEINSYTNGVTLSSFTEHLSLLETFVLRYPQHLTKVQIILENTNSKLDSYLKWKENEAIFWNWMESVLDYKLQDCVPPEVPKLYSPAALNTPTMHLPIRVLHLHKLNSQLQTLIEQWSVCAIDVDNKIKTMICKEKQATNPSKVTNIIQKDIYLEIYGYQSRSVLPSNACCQRFIHIQKTKKKKAEFNAPLKRTTARRTYTTVEETVDINDELCRLELKVNERRETLQQLRNDHQHQLESMFHGVKCICIPPLAKK
ncbi:tubulin epsilon and delta complex protein 1-like [Anneissia japonica]|uniref:tubulin epsilon and delta complex protein 1-like n=1 Tax=Anneissia japonica TaxID=1529436 RepID=UPI001425AE32|nr:tubulin epsilon and delta complex protein 1-like [Anneissia japonica]